MNVLDKWLTENEKYVKFEMSSEYEEEKGMRYPSNFYFINAVGDNIFIKARDRRAAQDLLHLFCEEWTGKRNTYVLRTTKIT